MYFNTLTPVGGTIWGGCGFCRRYRLLEDPYCQAGLWGLYLHHPTSCHSLLHSPVDHVMSQLPAVCLLPCFPPAIIALPLEP